MTQGYEANHSGKFLENIVQREFESRGFIVRDYGSDADNLDMFAPRILVRGVPYISIYETDSRSEFVVTEYNRKIRIECKWQESSGSVDEKFPYVIDNAAEAMPEREILILHGGGGARDGALSYLKRKAALVTHKKIWVLNINEFPGWVRIEFINGKKAA